MMASENIVLQAIKKMGYGGQTTGHGLRAAVSTGLEEMGYPIEIIKTQLSHAKENLTDAAYLRGVHLERRTKMMQVWADNLDAHVGGQGAAARAKRCGRLTGLRAPHRPRSTAVICSRSCPNSREMVSRA